MAQHPENGMGDGEREVEEGAAQRSLKPSQQRLLAIVQAVETRGPMTQAEKDEALDALAKWAAPQLRMAYGNRD